MSKIKYYDGGYKDIVMSIPTNTIEMTIKFKMYEDGEMFYAKQIFDLNDIRYAEDLFEQCCDGEYPVKNVKTTPLPVKEARYGFYKCKGRIKGE